MNKLINLHYINAGLMVVFYKMYISLTSSHRKVIVNMSLVFNYFIGMNSAS